MIFEIDFLKIEKKISRIENNNCVFFFLPFYHLGGAELVHLNIIKSISDKPTVTFFTMKSSDNHFKQEFYKNSYCIDINKFVRTHKDRIRISKYILKKMNQQEKLTIFGCHSYIFYFVLTNRNTDIRAIDLIHAFTDQNEIGHETESLPSLSKIDKRITITEHVREQLRQLYSMNEINDEENQKIEVIYNATSLKIQKNFERSFDKITLLYVGRNSPEKRIHLIGKIASRMKQMNLNFEMILIGSNLEEGINQEDRSSCTFLGALSQDEIAEWYQKAHVVLITSKREGFPMVFMEGMVFGCVPVSTNVGGIPELIKNEETGILIENSLDEDELIERFIREIIQLFEPKEKYKKISFNCSEFAKQHFTMERFNKEYRELILNE